MKLPLVILFSLSIYFSPLAQTPDTDYQQIHQVVGNYFTGWEKKDVELLNSVFHPESYLKYLDQNKKYQSVRIDQHIKDITKKEANFLPAHERNIDAIKIAFEGATATVHLRFKTFEVTDFFQLLKIEGTWKVVSKLSVSNFLKTEVIGN